MGFFLIKHQPNNIFPIFVLGTSCQVIQIISIMKSLKTDRFTSVSNEISPVEILIRGDLVFDTRRASLARFA